MLCWYVNCWVRKEEVNKNSVLLTPTSQQCTNKEYTWSNAVMTWRCPEMCFVKKGGGMKGKNEGTSNMAAGWEGGKERERARLSLPSAAPNFRRPNLIPGAITRFHIYEYLCAFQCRKILCFIFFFLSSAFQMREISREVHNEDLNSQMGTQRCTCTAWTRCGGGYWRFQRVLCRWVW